MTESDQAGQGARTRRVGRPASTETVDKQDAARGATPESTDSSTTRRESARQETRSSGSTAAADATRSTGRGSSTTSRDSSSSRTPAAAGRGTTSVTGAGRGQAPARKPRRARLRLTQVDAWTVMKTSFLLSIALGIVSVVAVAIVWLVLGAAGVFDSMNDTVQTLLGNDFRVQDYIGTGRILGFTMIVAVVDVVLLTAIATLAAFLYNLSATLLGGVEVTLTEDS